MLYSHISLIFLNKRAKTSRNVYFFHNKVWHLSPLPSVSMWPVFLRVSPCLCRKKVMYFELHFPSTAATRIAPNISLWTVKKDRNSDQEKLYVLPEMGQRAPKGRTAERAVNGSGELTGSWKALTGESPESWPGAVRITGHHGLCLSEAKGWAPQEATEVGRGQGIPQGTERQCLKEGYGTGGDSKYGNKVLS